LKARPKSLLFWAGRRIHRTFLSGPIFERCFYLIRGACVAGLSILKRAVCEPITLAQAKRQCRIDDANTLDDIDLEDLIADARGEAELHTARSYVLRTYREYFDHFPGHRLPIPYNVIYDAPTRHDLSGEQRNHFELSRSPLRSVSQIQYLDQDGAVQTLDPNIYVIAPHCEPAKIYHAPHADPWPQALHQVDSIWVDYIAGYGTMVTVTIGAASNAVTGAVFSQEDAGREIYIPGAGAAGAVGAAAATLRTTIAAVDENGAATLADEAVTAVAGVGAWLGEHIPGVARRAMLMLITHWFENRTPVQSGTQAELPYMVKDLLDQNRVYYQP
jgi:hypothetical protein